MGEMSAAENSAPLLHAFTTLAVSLGLGDAIPYPSAAYETPRPLPQASSFVALDTAAQHLLHEDQDTTEASTDTVPGTCCYMVLIEMGKRHIYAGPQWAKYFLPLEAMQQISNAKPGYYKFWLDVVSDPDERARRLHRCLRGWLDVPVVYDDNGRESFWHFCGTIADVSVRDRSGRVWMVDIDEFDVFVCGPPTRLRHSIRLHNFRAQRAAPEKVAEPLESGEAILRTVPGQETQVFDWDAMEIEPLDAPEIMGPLHDYLTDPNNPFKLDELG
ncbi:Hypothetical Protein FCC1311_064512 [Hondaea fermentalgiana]|uniref:Uncharacterized protein n=1 Tax=Hondaea fermentalgiana TaxID=2315210 RepID=A0A2R5GPH4_9STRA|nr:Hypothetical Protein FCC1311_064512 [Hondaea fermentalgiana]|eukprot:GBG30231.1 Hypothetical Protein FCC1311_064512 [Hondaea fermentalgiana]